MGQTDGHVRYIDPAPRGGATVLKVGGQIQRAERAENFFFDPPPLFGQWGGQNIAYIDKSA